MFESLAKQLRGGVPDRLSSVLGSDLRDTRRAMEVSLPALIGGLRDRAEEPGGPEAILTLVEGPAGAPIHDVDHYLTETDPRIGATALDQIFGSRGEPALTSLSKASGLSTKLLAQVMSMLGPVVTGWLGQKVAEDDMTSADVKRYLEGEADRLDQAGYGKVLALVGGRSQVASPTSTPSEPTPTRAPDPVVVGDADSRQRVVTVADSGSDQYSGAADHSSSGSMPAMAAAGAGAAAGMAAGSAMHGAHDAAPTVAHGQHDPTPIAPPTSATPMYAGADDDSDIDYGGDRSGRSILWWVAAGLMLVVAAFFVFQQCRGDDGDTTSGANVETGEGSTDDAAIKAAVENAVNPTYPNVTVTATDGTVVLSGNVADLNEKADAQQIATGVAGVTNVIDDMTMGTGNSIVNKIEATENLSQFSAMLDQFPEVKNQLQLGQANTVFVPTDAAFAADQDSLAALQADPASWEAVLKYHIAAGQGFSSTDLAGGGSVTTMQGEVLQTSANDVGDLVLNGVSNVVLADQPADFDGVIHAIDKVLVPESLGGEVVAPDAGGAADGTEGAEGGDGTGGDSGAINSELGVGSVTFESGSSVLTDTGKAEVDKVVTYMNDNPDVIMEIAGHTDSTGDEAANQTLSQQRADAVKAYMEESGISADRLTAVGYGESNLLVNPDDTEEAQAQNRRIEFVPQ